MLNGFFYSFFPTLLLLLLLSMLIAWVKKTDKGLNLIAVRVKGWVKRQAVDKNRSLSEIKVISAKGSHRPD